MRQPILDNSFADLHWRWNAAFSASPISSAFPRAALDSSRFGERQDAVVPSAVHRQQFHAENISIAVIASYELRSRQVPILPRDVGCWPSGSGAPNIPVILRHGSVGSTPSDCEGDHLAFWSVLCRTGKEQRGGFFSSCTINARGISLRVDLSTLGKVPASLRPIPKTANTYHRAAVPTCMYFGEAAKKTFFPAPPTNEIAGRFVPVLDGPIFVVPFRSLLLLVAPSPGTSARLPHVHSSHVYYVGRSCSPFC